MTSNTGNQHPLNAEKKALSIVPSGQRWKLIQTDGAGPFISRMIHRRMDGTLHIWTSRSHRKGGGLRPGIQAAEGRVSTEFKLWSPSELGWWISVLFMIGSACFALASLAGLAPELFRATFLQTTALNAVFFTGSLFFTAAAYLQLLEAANADRRAVLARGATPSIPFKWLGWQPGQIGWLSAAIQFAGTLLFNVNTADAMLPGFDWLQQDLLIWTPDVVGCICFLAASWLAVLECCHGMAIWKIQGISWWIVMINMLGSIGFGMSAIFAVLLPSAQDVLDLRADNLWTFIGAICFLFGAYLLLPEMARHRHMAAQAGTTYTS